MDTMERKFRTLLLAGLGAAALSRTGKDDLLHALAARGRQALSDGLEMQELRHGEAARSDAEPDEYDAQEEVRQAMYANPAGEAEKEEKLSVGEWECFLNTLSPESRWALQRAIDSTRTDWEDDDE